MGFFFHQTSLTKIFRYHKHIKERTVRRNEINIWLTHQILLFKPSLVKEPSITKAFSHEVLNHYILFQYNSILALHELPLS